MFLKYIVFFVFCFNISVSKAAEVIYDFDDDEKNIEILNSSGRLDLPSAERLREILTNEDTSPGGRLLFIGKYFDEKYPDELINGDFSSDIAALFPELSQQEVFDRTRFVRHAVGIYRAGMKKYTEIKESMLAPEEPPLIVDEDDYALPGQNPYIETPEGQVAVVYDFKKVLSYGNNPRDIKAMEAYQQRQLDKKEHKTAFDKFKSMVAKLEFSKLPFYGISLPNPLVGNAGIGEWQEQDGFKIRLTSDMAEIADKKKFLAAVHIDIPGHRFIPAISAADALQKPEIELIERENIESYQVYYPLPVTVADENMIGAYAGDLAFPITLTTVNPHQGIHLKAKVSFQSCDYDFNCKKMEFFPEVVVENAAENAASSVMNFVKQSYYNLPKEQNKNLKLKRIDTTLSDDGKTIEKILLVFNYAGAIDNFSLFLEDENKSRFRAPKVAVVGSEIQVSLTPENNQSVLPGQKAEITVRLNAYTSLRQSIRLEDFNKSAEMPVQNSFYFIWFGLLIGILFNFMPIALPLRLSALVKPLRRPTSFACFPAEAAGVFVGCNLFASLLIFFQKQNLPFVWGMQYREFFYLLAVIMFLTAVLLSGSYELNLLKHRPKIKAGISGFLLAALLPFSFTPFLAEKVSALLDAKESFIVLFFNMLAVGIASFNLCLPLLTKIKINEKSSVSFRKLLILISYFILIGMIIWLLFVLFLQFTLAAFLKMTALFFLFCFICTYVFSFLQALYQTRLPKTHKNIAEQVILAVFIISTGMIIWFSGNQQSHIPDIETASKLPENMHEELIKGRVVLIGITADWCLTCRFNDITVLNKRNLKRWNKSYRLDYIPLDVSSELKESKELLRRYGFVYPPLYILYSYNFEDGLVLSPLLVDSKLEQIIENAGI